MFLLWVIFITNKCQSSQGWASLGFNRGNEEALRRHETLSNYLCLLFPEIVYSKILERETDDKGQTFTKQVDTVNVQRDFFLFFSNLYKKEIDKEGMKDKITTFMGNTTTPTISAAQKDKCEEVVVESELLYALKQMKNGSAPGCDGITVEFLKMFWARISQLLTLSFNSAFENGNLSSSQRKAVITLIHKGKDLARDKQKTELATHIANKQ